MTSSFIPSSFVACALNVLVSDNDNTTERMTTATAIASPMASSTSSDAAATADSSSSYQSATTSLASGTAAASLATINGSLAHSDTFAATLAISTTAVAAAAPLAEPEINATFPWPSSSRLVQLMDQWTVQTNLSKYIELPCLAVMGDTSSGKSALLSNLSGVELPSSNQLTTRCPVLIRISTSYATINIAQDRAEASTSMESSNNIPVHQQQQNQQRQQARIHIQWKSMFPSSSSPPVFPERIITDDEWSTLPDVLREAQDFILQHTGKQVAPDTIVLQVQTRANSSSLIPLSTSLTLLDLPGFVKSRGQQDESDDLIVETEQLLQEYLRHHPRCVILAVIPANVDIHNSQILAHLQQQQQSGSTNASFIATVPVLTKPDLIDPGAEQDVLDLLLGKKITVSPQCGFHMVKGRGQAMLDKGMTIDEGLQDEEDFFRTVEPWKSLLSDTEHGAHLLGTRMLRRKLVDIQHDMIHRSIPTILHQIQTQQQQCRQQLDDMGQVLVTIADKRRFYQDLVQMLISQLKASLSGKVANVLVTTSSTSLLPTSPTNHRRISASSSSFSPASLSPTVAVVARAVDSMTTTTTSTTTISTESGQLSSSRQRAASAAAQLHEACSEFMELIRQGSLGTIKTIVEGAQVLVTSTKGEIRGQVVHLEEESFACVDFVDEKDHTVDVLFDYVGYQSQERLEEDDVWSDGKKVYIARSNNRFDVLKKIPLNRVRTDPYWLREKIAENRTDELPCFLNVDIFKNIVHEFIDEDWRPHCNALVDRTATIVLTTINESLQRTMDVIKACERYPNLRLRLQQQCQDAAMHLLQEAREQLHAHLHLESHPYTQDFVLFENIAQARYRGLRRQLEVALRLDEKPGEVRSGVGGAVGGGAANSGCVYDSAAIQTIIDGVFERNQKKSVEDAMAEEMELVLEAYGRVATQRVIDRTPMICWQVFRSLTPAIQEALWNATDTDLEVAMQENQAFAERYEKLKDELDEMNRAMEIFQSLQ